jgi:hypothetical protein
MGYHLEISTSQLESSVLGSAVVVVVAVVEKPAVCWIDIITSMAIVDMRQRLLARLWYRQHNR